MCCTEFQVTFSLQKAKEQHPGVAVQIWVYKDLGCVLDSYDAKWTAVLRGTSVNMDRVTLGELEMLSMSASLFSIMGRLRKGFRQEILRHIRASSAIWNKWDGRLF